MDLKDLNSPLPKPWLNPNVNDLTAASFASPSILSSAQFSFPAINIASGGGAVTLSPQEMVSGILIVDVGRSASIGLPLSANVDAYILTTGTTPVNGMAFQLNVVNREPTATLNLSSIEVPAQGIPKAVSGAVSLPSIFYFQRIGAVWTCLNN